MKMATNLWKPTEGTVELFGGTLENTSYEVFKRMGSIIEFPTFYEHMSGRDNLKLHCEYMGYYSRDSLAEALEMLGLLEEKGYAFTDDEAEAEVIVISGMGGSLRLRISR